MADKPPPPPTEPLPAQSGLTPFLVDTPQGEPLQGLPFAREIGVRVIRIGAGEALLSIPYDPRFIGDPETGVLHGGVVSSLLDTCGGVAAMNSATKPMSVATLDLRIDYMRPAKPGEPIFAHATCFRETRHITFIRGVAYQQSPERPIATAVGAFMVEKRAVWPLKAPPEDGADVSHSDEDAPYEDAPEDGST